MTDEQLPDEAPATDQIVEDPDETGEPQTDYEAHTVEDLRTLARERDLQVSGSKAELVARHELYDMQEGEARSRPPQQNPTNAPDSVPEMAGAVRHAIHEKNVQAEELRDHADGDDPLGAIRAPGEDADLGIGVDPLRDIRAPGDNVKIAENVQDPLASIRAPGAEDSDAE